MSKAGQYTFKGINTQAKASLLLFLLNLRSPDFDSVTLEDEKWEDFTLNFRSGKKIICESKDWNRPINAGDIKTIIEKIESSEDTINPNDEILIICNLANPQLKDDIKYLKYDLPDTIGKFQEIFSQRQIDLLKKVQFDEIAGRDIENEMYALLYDLLHFWLPQRDIENEIDRLLVQDIFAKSTRGATFTRTDLNTRINELRDHLIKNQAVRFPKDKIDLGEQLELLKNIAEGRESIEKVKGIDKSALTAQPEKTYYFLERIKDKKLDLLAWSDVWPIFIKGNYTFTLFAVFQNNHDTTQKAEYIVKFIIEHYEEFSSPIRDALFQEESLDLAQKILAQYPGLVNDVFELLKKVLKLRDEEYKKFETRRDHSREKELVSKLIQSTFKIYKNQRNKNKISEIISIIDSHFNLIDDDGKFVMYTPPEIFWVLRDYISLNFKQNFKEVVGLITNQYQNSSLYNCKFVGWDWAGSGVSQSGGAFSITDRHFITSTLQPAIEEYHKAAREDAWKFIKENCLSRNKNKVKKEKPDFLNRAVIKILLTEYSIAKHKKEAFEILSDFIKMRQGIPHKAALIFQTLKGAGLRDKDKWALVEVSLKEYNQLPVNVFVEQITSDLAAKGHQNAIKTLTDWVKNPEYTKRQGIGEFNIVDNLFKLLNQGQTFDQGVQILKEYLDSDAFQKELDRFDAFHVAKAVTLVLKKKPERGLEILKEIYESETLTTNQQIAICNSLDGLDENNPKLLLKVYNDFLSPLVKDLGDIKKVEERFDHRHARESLAQFAEKLARAKKFAEALMIAKLFIKDSDPPVENYPDDPKSDFNYHEQVKQGKDVNTISTVRGWICWVITQFCVLEGRQFIPEVVDLVEQLHVDENYYVRQMVCHALAELARIRHAVIPKNRERFIKMDIAGKIEEIAFSMLTDAENQKLKAVMKNLADVFSYIRSLEEDRAWKVVTTFKDCSFDEVIFEFAPVFIFFAEFRKDVFLEKQWEYLGEFNDKPFKETLENLLKNGSSEVKTNFAWRFWKLPKESAQDNTGVENILRYDEAFEISYRYLNILAANYDHQTFRNIYLFIRDNIDKRFDECYSLWRACLEKERKFLENNLTPEGEREMYWWPFHYNGALLVKLVERDEKEKFLDSFGFLSQYSPDIFIGDIEKAVKHLKMFPADNERVEKIFNKLIERDTRFYDDKEKWLKAHSSLI